MEEFDEMVTRLQKETEAEIAAASMVFWQAAITGFWDGGTHIVTSAFFENEDTAHKWLLEAQTKIAPLDQWTWGDDFLDPRFKDPKNGDDYEAGVYQQWTKD